MVLIFQSEKALKFLLRNGVVFTFRVKRRKKLGRDWVTDRRGGRKIADVSVEEEGKFKPSDLALYAEYSGFNSLEEWLDEIRRLNRGSLPVEGWLYRATLC